MDIQHLFLDRRRLLPLWAGLGGLSDIHTRYQKFDYPLGHFPEAECLPLLRNSLKLVVCLIILSGANVADLHVCKRAILTGP